MQAMGHPLVPGYNTDPVSVAAPTISLNLEDLEALLTWGSILCGDVVVRLEVDPAVAARGVAGFLSAVYKALDSEGRFTFRSP